MKIKLSLIIVSYNSADILIQCLDSVFKYNDIGSQLEVIVSDNSPRSDLCDALNKKYDKVKVIHNKDNRGFGYGNNQGEKIASGDYLLFLNPDTVLVEPIFSWAIEQFDKNPKLAMFGVKLLKPDYSLNNSFMWLDTFGLRAWILNKVCQKLNIFIEKRMFISGADTFIRRNIFEQIGGFDESIFMYYEESDLHHRFYANEPEMNMAYFPNKRIVHLEGGTQDIGDGSVESYKRQLNTFMYYCDKYNINFKSALNSEISLLRLKKIKYKIFHQHDKYNLMCKTILAAADKLGKMSSVNIGSHIS